MERPISIFAHSLAQDKPKSCPPNRGLHQRSVLYIAPHAVKDQSGTRARSKPACLTGTGNRQDATLMRETNALLIQYAMLLCSQPRKSGRCPIRYAHAEKDAPQQTTEMLLRNQLHQRRHSAT